MPRPRFQRAPVEKRDAVLDAAAKEFAAHGYDDASVNRILLAAGFSKGAFYYYFDDKLDLAAAVLEREAPRYLAMWSELGSPRSKDEFWAELRKLADLSTAQMRKVPATTDALLRLGSAMARHPELLARVSGPFVAEASAKLAKFWKCGQDVGAVRKDLPIATVIALLQDIKIVLIRMLLPHDRAPTREEFEGFTRIHMDLIRRVSEAQPRPIEHPRRARQPRS
jgi:AcrR family transcriptional regulator